jgi:glycosyltransferase involved in cell wall biosynthesis
MTWHKPVISIIVPTRSSARTLSRLLSSLTQSEYKNFEVVVNDDLRTDDNTKETIVAFRRRGLAVSYLRENLSRAQARKRAAESANGEILLHLDADMQVTTHLLGECADLIDTGYDALVIPEESYGTTYWAKCKGLEKRCYTGVDEIESLRCLRRSSYEEVGGHDPRLVFSEDKDLDLRVRASGAKIGRTTHYLLHDEGSLKLLETVRKKIAYADTADLFAKEHPQAFAWQRNILMRYRLYLKNLHLLTSHPLLYAGMVLMKTAEYLGVLIAQLQNRFRPAKERVGRRDVC